MAPVLFRTLFCSAGADLRAALSLSLPLSRARCFPCTPAPDAQLLAAFREQILTEGGGGIYEENRIHNMRGTGIYVASDCSPVLSGNQNQGGTGGTGGW